MRAISASSYIKTSVDWLSPYFPADSRQYHAGTNPSLICTVFLHVERGSLSVIVLWCRKGQLVFVSLCLWKQKDFLYLLPFIWKQICQIVLLSGGCNRGKSVRFHTRSRIYKSTANRLETIYETLYVFRKIFTLEQIATFRWAYSMLSTNGFAQEQGELV